MSEEESISRNQSEEKRQLKQIIVSISSLISLSHSIRVFSVKWQVIRNKLDELLSNLAAIENCELGESASLSVAVESILATVGSCDELANRCLGFSYCGKLLMQSDLDMLSAKLDVYIKSVAEIFAEWLLTQSYALVVSRPSISASKDDMRFYINDLLSRMKIGNSQMKKQALIAFNDVVREDDRYVKIAVEIDGFINLLVNFLDFHENGVQEEAAKSVSLIAGFQSCKSVLVGAGIIGPLISGLELGNGLSKEYATRCLMKVTENSDNVWSVSAHGGVTALLKICHNDSHCRSELISLACGVLKNLVAVEEIKRFMVEEGAISELIELVRSKDEVVQISSLDLLQTMANKDEYVRERIFKEGGIRVLAQILDPVSSVSTKTREMAFRGITNICYSSENSISILINYSFIDHILYFLRYGEFSVQELALKAAFWLCGTSEAAKKVMGNAGFMPVLVKFLDSKSFEVREMAAESLSSLLDVPRIRKKFVQNDQNVVVLLQMLDITECQEINCQLRTHENHRKAGRS